ncbi:hypothetical protein DPMN_173077 [Dreissena polymorpha]|uniref:Uncharacterized protein n=1 Tax=Dreissena polymorpha TaxID=45954 RepID=A0A9D4E4E4_DREPO|nr:hypothetical protein DPMN_173077 [Dreissena polymorpha]
MMKLQGTGAKYNRKRNKIRREKRTRIKANTKSLDCWAISLESGAFAENKLVLQCADGGFWHEHT